LREKNLDEELAQICNDDFSKKQFFELTDLIPKDYKLVVFDNLGVFAADLNDIINSCHISLWQPAVKCLPIGFFH